MNLNAYNKIVCIGDSLTFGYGVSKSKNWISLLNKSLNLNIINKGINGDTSTGILSRFFSDVLNFQTEICIIMCGTNDILCGRKIDFIIDNINLMVNDCLSHNIKPILLSPPNVLGALAKELWDSHIDYDKVNKSLDTFDNELKLLCNFTNINFISLKDTIPVDNSYYLDGVHLNEKGNILIFEKIKDIF